jgi:hypothetical protein
MAGGIAILLLIIALLVVGGIALAAYGTGGFLWMRKTNPQRDQIADVTEDDVPSEGEQRRPQHTRPTSPAQERTDFAGREAHRHG